MISQQLSPTKARGKSLRHLNHHYQGKKWFQDQQCGNILLDL